MYLPNYILSILIFVLVSTSVLGQSGKKKIPVPNVVGMTLKEARKLLDSNNLQIGAIVYSEGIGNLDSSIVYRQNPPAKNKDGTQNFMFFKNPALDLFVDGEKVKRDTSNIGNRRIVPHQEL